MEALAMCLRSGLPIPHFGYGVKAFVLEVPLADCPSSQVDNLSISFRWAFTVVATSGVIGEAETTRFT